VAITIIANPTSGRGRAGRALPEVMAYLSAHGVAADVHVTQDAEDLRRSVRVARDSGHERRWAIGFVAVAVPLFASGVMLAYFVLPYGLELLFGFTPANVENIVAVDRYLSFFIRMVIVFGVGFLAPLMLVLLNFAGILTGKRLLSWWRWIIFITFIFAAVATPTGDPINMLLLAGPILLLMTIAISICLANDKRRARKGIAKYDEWDDDEASPLEPADQD
jgi:sec-independent protein translocase protein TatC